MQIFLRSQNCTSRDDESGYTWLYPKPVTFGQPGDLIEVCVSLLQWFPITRNIDRDDEYIVVSPRDPNGEFGFVFNAISFARGNYSIDDIVRGINDYFRALPADERVEASFDQTNLKLVLKRPTESTLYEDIAIQGSPLLLNMLGFPPGSESYRVGGALPPSWVWVDGAIPVWAGPSLKSPSIVNFAGPTHATIETSLQTTNVADETLSSSVLAKVPIVGAGFGELQTYQDTSTFSTLAEHEITGLTVRFRDSFGNPIDFGDLPWNMSLLFRVTPSGVYTPLEDNYSDTPPENGNPSQLPSTSEKGT